MNIFILGLPKSGKTTVATAIAKLNGWEYIDPTSWFKDSFRSKKPNEKEGLYEDEFHQYVIEEMKNAPNKMIDGVLDFGGYDQVPVLVVDGLTCPRDFISLFDYKKDVVVFLNRTDNDHDFKDYENISTLVMRDYCVWMAAYSLLDKNRWLEYNFQIPGDNSDTVKELGAKNSVVIVRGIDKVVPHLQTKLYKIIK